ncbi:MAG: hypothetical protein Q4C83_00415 [Candidatus Saccharibacteria bacterium]|nr:hypothetical protein [Candidatus Saccharibacteria bacterium]
MAYYIDTLSINNHGVTVYGANKETSGSGEDSITNGRPMVWPGYIDVYFGHRCDGMDKVVRASRDSAAVVVQLERGNKLFYIDRGWEEGRQYYCADLN